MPADHQPFETPDARPVEELVLRLTDPRLEVAEGKRRGTATARLEYAPATSGARRMESRRYTFIAPLGPIELHDGRTWLFQGGRAVRVRRRLPNRHPQPARLTALPIRILLVSPRPENDGRGNRLGYIDHRITARPLTEAVEGLGDLARLTILQPPTIPSSNL